MNKAGRTCSQWLMQSGFRAYLLQEASKDCALFSKTCQNRALGTKIGVKQTPEWASRRQTWLRVFSDLTTVQDLLVMRKAKIFPKTFFWHILEILKIFLAVSSMTPHPAHPHQTSAAELFQTLSSELKLFLSSAQKPDFLYCSTR